MYGLCTLNIKAATCLGTKEFMSQMLFILLLRDAGHITGRLSQFKIMPNHNRSLKKSLNTIIGRVALRPRSEMSQLFVSPSPMMETNLHHGLAPLSR